ncbi:MAG: hypothetical protein JWP57_3246 [Spirosoma sp.]|nr:hypothetical protein [Spirosoma sp.]
MRQQERTKKEYDPEIQAAIDRQQESAREHKRTREVYDLEVLEYLTQSDELEDLLAGNYKLIKRPAKYEERKQLEYEIYQQERDDNYAIRTRYKLTNTDEETAIFYKRWLQERLIIIERELSPTNSNGNTKPRSDFRQSVELEKYRNDLLTRIKATETEIELLRNQDKGGEYDINPATSPLVTYEQEFTQKQRILIHFYEGGNMLERKHKEYNDYNKYCTSKKRLAYNNDSESKLKYLIQDIEKVINYLSDKGRNDAETELFMLKSRLTVEK